MSISPRVAPALLLGVVSFFLLFLLGEGVRNASAVPAAGYLHVVMVLTGMGGYFVISGYWLSRGNPRAVTRDWPVILALNLPLFATAVIAAIAEPDKSNALEIAGLVAVAVVCSCAGAALAARAARP